MAAILNVLNSTSCLFGEFNFLVTSDLLVEFVDLRIEADCFRLMDAGQAREWLAVVVATEFQRQGGVNYRVTFKASDSWVVEFKYACLVVARLAGCKRSDIGRDVRLDAKKILERVGKLCGE